MFFVDTLKETQGLVEQQENIIRQSRHRFTYEQFEYFMNNLTQIKNEIASIPDDTREMHLANSCHCVRATDMIVTLAREVRIAIMDNDKAAELEDN